jgi:C4-dicarboxylate-specific signal transduction histidine kinase
LERVKNDPEKFAAKVNSVKDAVGRISKIVQGLRKFGKNTTESVQKFTPAADVVRESLVLTEPRAKLFFVNLDVQLQTGAKILCDEVELNQVLVNLINNGIDAARELPEKWVKLILFEEEAEVIFQVRDSGVGLTVQVQQKLFQPFFTTKEVGQGTGLGLSVSKGILDQHRADIDYKLIDGHTCFEVRFPKVPEPK